MVLTKGRDKYAYIYWIIQKKETKISCYYAPIMKDLISVVSKMGVKYWT